MKTIFKLLVGAVLVSAGLAQAAPINLIENGSFEKPGIPTNTASQFVNTDPSNPFAWITGANGVELRDNRNFPAGYTHIAADGDQYIELAVEGNVANGNSSIWQEVFLKAGQEYTLSFAYSPRAPFGEDENEANVSFVDWSINLVADASSQSKDSAINLWKYVTVKLIGTGDTERLTFAAAGSNGSYGMFFDDVSLTATPLPGAALLFGTSLAGFLAARKRRKAAALAA